jgi:DNA-binding SARP family transcriptional activator
VTPQTSAAWPPVASVHGGNGLAPTGAAPLEFDILGPVRARRGEREVDLGPAKQRAVLAVLLLEANRPVAPARIVAAVWGAEPPGNGANVVQKYVAGLRRVLEPHRSPRAPSQLLGLQPAGYQLTVEPGRLDADAFAEQVRRAAAEAEKGRLDEAGRQLSAALGRWRGEPLAGLSGPVFESARHRLAERRAAAWELRAEVLLRSGRHAELVPDLVRLVEEFPLRERIRYLHMLALYRSGRQAEALAAYSAARRRLVEEFAVEPGEPLRRLHTQILRSDPALAIPTPTTPAPTTPGQADRTPAGQVPAGPTWAAPMPAIPTPTAPAPTTPGQADRIPAGQVPTGQVPTGPTWASPTLNGPAPAADGVPLAAAAPIGVPPWPQATAAAPGGDLPRWRTRTARTIAVLVPLLTLGLATWLVFGWLAGWFRQRRPAYLAAAYFALVLVWMVGVDTMDPEAPVDLRDGIGLVALLLCWLGGTAHLALLMFRPPRPD